MMKKRFSFFATLAAFAALAIAPTYAAEDHDKQTLDGYFAVADALFKDDLKAARKAASDIAKHKDEALAESAAKLAEAEDIAGARSAFTVLSAKAIELAGDLDDQTYTVMHCPMVKDGKGDWLSIDAKVKNPYMGAKMPNCGGPKK